MMEPTTIVLQEVVKQHWHEYASLRFSAGEHRERNAWAQFVQRTEELYSFVLAKALRAGIELDFDIEHIQRMALDALDHACPYCMKVFGLGNFALTFRTPPARGARNLYALANLAICDQRCADAKGELSESEWIDVLAALRGADQSAASNAVDRLIAGATPKVPPDALPLRVTREPRYLSRKTRKS